MKNNKGITLVELIIVAACLSLVTMFFWTVLSSSSEDSYTINDKIEVQNNVTVLMNLLQADIQQASPKVSALLGRGIFFDLQEDLYIINGAEGLVRYEFDEVNRTVKRIIKLKENGEADTNSSAESFPNITEFLLEPMPESGDKLGAKVKIVGGKDPDNEVDRSRYELNSTYYTRNTR